MLGILPQVIPSLHRGRFRLEVRTSERSREANADDRWKVVSAKDLSRTPIWSRQLSSHVRGGPEERSILLRTVWRGIRSMLCRQMQIPDPVPRRLYLKQRDFMAHGTSDRCQGCHMLSTMTRQSARWCIHTQSCSLSPDQVMYLSLSSDTDAHSVNGSRKRFTAYDTQSFYFITEAWRLVT